MQAFLQTDGLKIRRKNLGVFFEERLWEMKDALDIHLSTAF